MIEKIMIIIMIMIDEIMLFMILLIIFKIQLDETQYKSKLAKLILH